MPRKETAKNQKEHFEVGQWKGFARWQCTLCRFDTLEGEEAIREHLASVHFPPPVERKVARRRLIGPGIRLSKRR